jgi:hypothetical protein
MEEGRANPRQLWIHKDNLDAFKREVERIKETALRENGYAPLLIMQATHSGRYSKPAGKPAPLIAYNNPIFEKDNPISSDRIVTDDYLDRVGEALIKGAILAEKAGKAIDINGACLDICTVAEFVIDFGERNIAFVGKVLVVLFFQQIGQGDHGDVKLLILCRRKVSAGIG